MSKRILLLLLAASCANSAPQSETGPQCPDSVVLPWAERQGRCEATAEDSLNAALEAAAAALDSNRGQKQLVDVSCQLLVKKLDCVSTSALPSCLDADEIRLEIAFDLISTSLSVYSGDRRFNLGVALGERCPAEAEAAAAVAAALSGGCGLREYAAAVAARRDCGDRAAAEKERRLELLNVFPSARGLLFGTYCQLKSTLETECRGEVLPCLGPEQRAALIAEEENQLFAGIEDEVRTDFGEQDFSFQKYC